MTVQTKHFMQEDSASHRQVLHSLKKLKVSGHDISVEEKGNRLDLPNEQFQAKRKGVAQRKRSLCYTDAIIHANRVPRVLLEVVDNNPTVPNGITGLTVNVDRVAGVHLNIDLMFIVLAEMKDFYCSHCGAGHRLSNRKKLSCLKSCLGANPDENAFRSLIHEGKAANFKKALIDYPIRNYLRHIQPPSVLFLNATKVSKAWGTYEDYALHLIEKEIEHIIGSGERSETRLIGLPELMPEWISTIASTEVRATVQHALPTDRSVPPPGSEVSWESPSGHQSVVIKNRGQHNTRVRFPDGRTEKVPNTQLHW